MKLKFISIDEKKLKDYIVIVAKSKVLSAVQTAVLTSKFENTRSKTEAESIKRELVESNLRVVTGIANKYRGAGVTFAGLIAVGNRALVKSVKSYSGQKLRNFVQHILWNVEGAVMKAVADVEK